MEEYQVKFGSYTFSVKKNKEIKISSDGGMFDGNKLSWTSKLSIGKKLSYDGNGNLTVNGIQVIVDGEPVESYVVH